MTGWRGTALAFGAVPEIGALQLSRKPAFVFARDGGRVLWANVAGGRFVGAAGFASLAERRWGESDPLARAIASLARALPKDGTLARLRLTGSLSALPALCRCRPVRAGDERGILVAFLEDFGDAPSPRDLAAFYSDASAGAAIFDARGAVLAEGAPGIAEAVVAETASVEVVAGDEPLRLCIVERFQRTHAFVGATSASTPVLDGPALSTVGAAAPTRQEPAAAAEPPRTIAEPSPRPADAEPDDTAAVETPSRMPAAPRSVPTRRAPAVVEASAPAPAPRSVKAGRVQAELSRRPVRFLWQTDGAHRFLFLSPGLAQVVGRNADVVGERWQEVAARLRLDPHGRIARALTDCDTWSGLTAWWPIEGSNVRVPVELTALPVFGSDQSFQGYRGFGILRPAEALMPATFEARFGAAVELGEPQPPYEESPAANVVPIRADIDKLADSERLTAQERSAFEEIAQALRERIVDGFAAKAQAQAERELEEAGDPAETDFPEEPPTASRPQRREEREDAPGAEPAFAAAPPVFAEPADPRREPASDARVSDARISELNDQLADARRRLREMIAILDTATDGVVVLDEEGVIESVNASAEALFGLEAHRMVGRPLGDLLRPESRDLALDYLSGLKDNGVASLLNEGREIEAVAGAGSIPLFMTMGRVSSEEGQRFCAVLRDITHWKRIEAELTKAKQAAEQASTQKSEFLSRVGNEIRPPLNAIVGFAESMIEERFGPIDNERYREQLREIRASGEHVVNLVNDLLDVSRVEAGELKLEFSAVPLNEVLKETIGLVQPQANRGRVVLRSSLSREVPAIVGDDRSFRQIVLNLLSNAVRHAGVGGQVIASTSLSERGEALLRIRDTGHGMSDEEIARALEPFPDLSLASLVDRPGSGLVLPLTKALVEANRAMLSIRSARGEGTVVTVTVPPTRVLSE